MTRKRIEGTALNSFEEVDTCLKEIGGIDRELAMIEAWQNEQIDRIKADAKLQEVRANLELQASNDQRDSEREMLKAQMTQQLEAQKLEFQQWLEQAKLQSERELKEMEIAGRIQVAQISAQTAISTASIAAQQAAASQLQQDFDKD